MPVSNLEGGGIKPTSSGGRDSVLQLGFVFARLLDSSLQPQSLPPALHKRALGFPGQVAASAPG